MSWSKGRLHNKQSIITSRSLSLSGCRYECPKHNQWSNVHSTPFLCTSVGVNSVPMSSSIKHCECRGFMSKATVFNVPAGRLILLYLHSLPPCIINSPLFLSLAWKSHSCPCSFPSEASCQSTRPPRHLRPDDSSISSPPSAPATATPRGRGGRTRDQTRATGQTGRRSASFRGTARA